MITATFTCPDCKLALAAVASGSAEARRCARCRGIWLDPASFRRLVEDEARPPDEATAIAMRGGPSGPAARPPAADRVRYRACPRCGEVMNRTNFGRVSGVVIDVCRPHGAWFDRGELRAIRAFLGSGGLERYARRQREAAARSRTSGRAARTAPRPGGDIDDIYDVLAGGDPGWDVPSRVPRLLVAALFAAAGAAFLWLAFHRSTPSADLPRLAPLSAGLVCLYLAWRALGQWLARRGRRAARDGEPP